MDSVRFLLGEVAVFGAPLAALGLSRRRWRAAWSFLPVVVALVGHAAFYVVGISFRGDVWDYALFWLDYLAICFVLLSVVRHAKHRLARALAIVGLLPVAMELLLSLPLFWMLPIAIEDEGADEVATFGHEGRSFETRRYCPTTFAWSGLTMTCTFKTYRVVEGLGVEQLVRNEELELSVDVKPGLALERGRAHVAAR